MKVLYIGGTGQISFNCVHQSVKLGHEVSVYNRGNNNAGLPGAVRFITGDIHDDAAYAKLADEKFDVVCQFRIFNTDEVQRDIDLFAGNCGQYVFIGTASSYQSPPKSLPITEDTPLENPFWAYSQAKTAMEMLLRDQDQLPYTIVRPSHTYRTAIPPTAVARETNVSRLLRGKPVVMHGDGTSLWTLTHSEDFAPLFVWLLGNDRALGEDFHITHDQAWPWNEILAAAAAALGVQDYQVVHVPSHTMIRYNPEWEGALLGDKTPSVMFDNSKVKAVAGDIPCTIDPWEGMRKVAASFPIDPNQFDPQEEALLDRIASDQGALGK